MAQDNDYILNLLKANGMLTDEQIASGQKMVDESDGKIDILHALERLEFLDSDQLLRLLAREYGMEVIDLEAYVIPRDVIATLPSKVAQQYEVVPIMQHNDTITIATSDPSDVEKIDSLRYVLGCDIDVVAAKKTNIDAIIEREYTLGDETVEKIIDEFSEENALMSQLARESGGSAGAIGEDSGISDDDSPIAKLVILIITNAYNMQASDIHMEPLEKRYRIRYRLDGVLFEVDAPPKYLQNNLTQRLKIMAKLDISEKRIPQDGRINIRIGEAELDLRVSTIPTTHGESIVMRILDKSSIQLDIPQLGFFVDDLALIKKIISLPDGIFLVTGPTGSGKTTSLYAFLNAINTPNRKIITVEDPIEYQLSGINQVQADNAIGMTFSLALRSILRQAPNIIMVGEIRDQATAEIAINAALTGHLVFSTLHTNDAPGAITRLTDMGVKSFLVASGVRAIMAQRLLRRVCKNCSMPHEPTGAEKKLLNLSDEYLANHQFYIGRGCELCGGTGYKGRLGVYEIFMVTPDISELIFNNEPDNVIRARARENGMRSLRDDALRKAETGVTSLEEVVRLTVSKD